MNFTGIQYIVEREIARLFENMKLSSDLNALQVQR